MNSPPFIPAQAGTQEYGISTRGKDWIPAFAGTNGY
jgi:hypothetical protein